MISKVLKHHPSNRYQHPIPKNQLQMNSLEPIGNYLSYMGWECLEIELATKLYTDIPMGLNLGRIFWRVVYKIMLLRLKYLEKHSKNSDEMLCFAYHVVATKL